jgi:transcription-repair coupling factor (superfamily II helicase)
MQLAELVPEARIGIGHGQMNEHDLEAVMLSFINHKIDILVATTIIESGLDIPNANTIFVNNAGHFGLSELHQLRGRVGRYKNRAFAYFLVPSRVPLSPEARRRLSAIEEFAGLGAGFELAIRDLEIRGAGNIMGLEQSGHILQIGYELYCRLLDRVVKELRGEAVEEREPVELELGTNAWIPDDYITLEKERLRTYRDLAACDTAEALDELRLSLIDRYGDLPKPMQELLRDEVLRQQAQRVGINYIGRLERAIILGFTPYGEETHLPTLRTYKEKRRKTTPLEGNRYRFGLGYYEEEWDGYQTDLVQVAIRVMSGGQPTE